MVKKKNTVESKLLAETMDSDTLEDKAEKEDLLIESECDKVSEMVKMSYKKLTAGHAIVRQKFAIIYAIVLGMMFFGGLTMIILYGFVYWGREGAALGFIGIVPVAFAIGISVVVFQTCHKLFDVYFCKFNGKRIIFYVNKKYSILYKSRTDIICINNYTGQEIKYTPDDFMNIKLGFNRLVGILVAKKFKNGYKIRTKQFKRFSISRFNGNSTLWIYNDMTPKKILIGESYIYKFKIIDVGFAENSQEIAMLLEKFKLHL